MQSISHFAGHLTLLYDETKKKALSSTGKNESVPALSHLDLKYRIQKDRLVTWGLEWTREDKGQRGDIDASVAQAGMTETVTSVLGNISEVLEQAEKIRAPVSVWPAPEKLPLSTNVETKYADLIKDLTSSVDILYEISITRRAIASGSHPTFSSDQIQHEFAPGTIASDPDTKERPFQFPSYASSELTLVNPSFARPSLSPYAGLPLSIDPQALILPAEAPPPYESFGVPSATRMIGRVIRSRLPETVRRVLPTSSEAFVLVEYANYDFNHELLYHQVGVPPPLQRLETLSLALAAAQSKRNRSLILLGYFEDPHQPRVGLVYDFLSAVHGNKYTDDLFPVSLLNLLQTANKSAKAAELSNAMPFLEDRFKVALNIAQNLRDLHAEGFSHGNLNSGSVIFFRQGHDTALRRGELHLPTLSAFDIFSGTGIERRHDSSSRLNITMHPHDHGSGLNRVKAIQYDLYGLALLLLEIGLWTPLHDIYKQKYSLKDFKLRIEKIWIPRLASKCGSLYMRAVQNCIRLSDDTDMNKIDVDALYGSIIRRLQRCCFLDEDEPILPENGSPQDQAALWQSLASNSEEESPAPRLHAQRVVPPQGRVASPALSLRSESTLSDNTVVRSSHEAAGLPSIATTISRHHHHLMPRPTARKIVHGNVPAQPETILPFREFRQKVILMQRCWRDCRRRRLEGSNMPAAHGAISSHSFENHTSSPERRMGMMETRRSSESVRRCQVYPIRHPQPALEKWHSDLGLRISRIVERALKNSAETSSIDLVGFGQDSSTAKPTIVVTCASTARVKAALKNKFDYDRSKFDLKVRKGRISLARGKGSARDQLAKRASGAATDSDDGESDALNPYFQQKPLCGASIGAYIPSYGHLDPVSYGGVVVVERGGKMESFGMSVHHMLDPPDEDEQASSLSTSDTSSDESRSGSDLEVSDSSDFVETSDEDSYLSSEFETDISDDEPTTSIRSRLAAHSHSSRPEPGDKPGIAAHSVPIIQVTQPAFIDAWNQDLHADDAPLEELDDDHLSSYRFGSIYASSGLRRVTRNGMRHEIDWALIKLDPPRLQPYNLIQGGKRYSPDRTKAAPFCPNFEQPVCRQRGVYTADEDIYPQDIVPSSQLAGLDVHCFGRTSGLATGTINAYVSFVKIRGRRTFSACWSVLSESSPSASASSDKGTGSFGVGGDSGAWIVDNRSSRVCGHVLAERNGMAYLCSMQLLLEDMKTTLGASRILLPGAETADALDAQVNAKAASSAVAAAAAAKTKTTTLDIATQLGEDVAGALSRLDVRDRVGDAADRGGFVRARTGHWKTTHIPVPSTRNSNVGAGVVGAGMGVKGECRRLSGDKHRQAVRT